MTDIHPTIWLIQKDFGYEGHADIVAISDAEEAATLHRELGGDNHGYVLEEVPLATSATAARVEMLTIEQNVSFDGEPGRYQETREKVWSFESHATRTTLLGTSLGIVAIAAGVDHDEVRTQFTTTLQHARERASQGIPRDREGEHHVHRR